MAAHINSMQLDAIPSLPKAPTKLRPASKRDEDLIERIRREFLVLQQQQTAISKRIAVIKAAVIGLAQVFGSGVIGAELEELLFQPSRRQSRPHPGLTDLCHKSLRESRHPLTLPEILEQIRAKNPAALAKQKNPRVSLSVVLRRLVDYNEAERILITEGLHSWKWTCHRVEATNHNDSPSQSHRVDGG
jgi:hypothetical protein